ncbi:hypothetical protein F5B22DRAFT_630383 [Xylaria bambusicola]|uniref:uncharacterized protein n=1 Tax=Xylaria bambusicola TaxID=326684 RepID=UPI0020085AB9|nr:uncharacterized protein F5B22DRAFT_630383 [Xylaria bambusicola]KAI0503160.1 hypothetical protein F5B22DRAFT_630383 [Xylaria bambusicola]
MAQHAWLDSLSEDWVSQPSSDTSQAQLPSPSSPPVSSMPENSRDRASRIPRFNGANPPGIKRQQHHPLPSSPSVLSERNPNDINIRAAQLKPSRLSQENKASYRGRHFSRSSSASTAGSVIHNSVLQTKSHSASPSKDRENEPEWKKRLIYGELDYGESKDLFSSAATGLENIFRPPQPSGAHNTAPGETEGHTINETTLPSSPPPYLGNQNLIDENDEIFEQDSYETSIQHNMSLPKPVFFRSTADDDAGISSGDTAPIEGEDLDELETKLDGEPESSAISFRRRQLLDESRKISGQSDTRNEDFSPILIARHSSEGGRVSFSPMELPAQQLRKKLENLRRNQMILDPEPDMDSGQVADVSSGAGIIENTEDFARNGGFLNLQRGERSIDGSFRRRPLSPPINMDTSDMLPESSLQASTPKQFPTVRTERFASAGYNQNLASPPSPSLPRAPHPSPEKRPQPTSVKTSSPLKLFGPYDTFTNQTLLRRISQFEDQQSNHNSMSYAADETTGSLPPLDTESKPQNKVSSSSNPAQKNATRVASNHQDVFDTVNRFGAGELDQYEFEGDISLASSMHSHSEEKENVAPPRSRVASDYTFKFDIHEDMPSEQESLFIGRTRGKVTRSWSSARHIRVSKSWDGLRSRMSTGPGGLGSLHLPITQRDGSEGKRPRTSPSKDPTPKRRRTLHRSDIAYGIENWRAAIETVKSSHYTMQSVITEDRKQIHQAEIPELVDPNVQSAHILRPRSPTPNQRASEARDRQPLAELNFNPVHGSAKDLMSEHHAEDTGINASRKTSMKTQDFYDAAEEVMAMIRNKARPATGLASVEESEAESSHRPALNDSVMSEASFEESTREPFSRPPSRDGRPIARLPVRQEDPELVNRLKKYEEQGDLDDILSQSLRSMKNLQINDQSIQSDQVYDEDGVISDIPNVRISRNPDQPEASRNPTEFPSHKSQSSNASTRRSAPTSSSRGSDSRRLIAPDVVAQLIGNQVGNMVFDDKNKMWQKVKAPRPTLNILPSEDSEDDPFASIPDLTVDTVKERKHLDLTAGKTQANPGEEPECDNSLSWTSSRPSNTANESLNSKHSAKQDGGANAEVAVEDDEEIEHEISLHEDRIQKASPSRPKNLTITFSSPIASIIQDLPQRDFDDDSYSEESNLGHSIGSIAADSIKGNRHVRVGRSVSAMATRASSRSRSRGVQKSVSVEGHTFVPRPVSRIDERDEDAPPEGHTEEVNQKQISIHDESAVIASEQEDMGNPELSVVMATPNPARATAMLGTPIIGQYVGTFSLSPMSEFTVHQMDTSCALEVSYVMGDQYLMTGDGSKKSMSKAVRTLVEKITEVEPFEPDWETVPELDLSNKQLDTLHMLDEFCTTLVTLDVSNNKVPHLDGVPQSVRNLRITHNALSELTAWRQLMNLQYVDVSNNQIKSLSAFKDLVHLRTLRADNNQITSLDGIKFHDSLQVLRARGNLITHVDFDGTKMQRLTELDLENNQIVAFENGEQLASLNTLNLQHNRLTSFAPSEGQYSLSLSILKLSNNELETLDLSALPSLRVLHVDRNNITVITGLSHCRRLDSLSLREQKGNQALNTSFLDSAYEVRKLFLSGNRLSGFNPQVDFLNLQYLELANCGLQSLSPNLGQLMPNLRMLNINFNAIDDLWPLRYIPRLKKLLAAENRLSDAQKISSALAEFPHLSRLDLRNNGATLGFYAPVHALVSAENDGKEGDFDPFTLPDVDVERQDKFASRLDMDTRMRKRVYDLVVLKDCRQLKMLDGLL